MPITIVAQYFEQKFSYNNIGIFQNNYHYLAHPQTVKYQYHKKYHLNHVIAVSGKKVNLITLKIVPQNTSKPKILYYYDNF